MLYSGLLFVNDLSLEHIYLVLVYGMLIVLIAGYWLLPFYGLLWLFQSVKFLRRIPYDGWMLQAVGCVSYFLLIFFDKIDGIEISPIGWALCYYPLGIGLFFWYHWLKKNKKIEV
nr:hypothetical protein [uncultured Fluviicola sp.]